MIRRLDGLSLLSLLLALACSPDQITQPRVETLALAQKRSAICSTQLNPDASCYTTRSYYDLGGSLTVNFELDVPSPPPYVPCPKAMYLKTFFAEINDVDPSLPFLVTGNFVLKPGSTETYNFPQVWWNAIDGSNRKVKIGSGDAVCIAEWVPPNKLKLHVIFYRYHDVQISSPITGT